ncbi:MAG: hypothetical protein V2A76_19015, partial [Planctomycetota bacterium]
MFSTEASHRADGPEPGILVNRGYEYRDCIRPEDAGSTVIAVLARRYRNTDREGWLVRLDRGEVLLD